MIADLTRVALRQNKIYFPQYALESTEEKPLCPDAFSGAVFIHLCGYDLTKRALAAFNNLTNADRRKIVGVFVDIFGLDRNWTPLVRDWLKPTGQTQDDMEYATVYNMLDRVAPGELKGERLPCGHIMPPGLFDLKRYTGCPLCGRPFETNGKANFGGPVAIKARLDIFTDNDARALLRTILEMTTPPDATQLDSLLILLSHFPIPNDVTISIKEIAMYVVSRLIAIGDSTRAAGFLKSPADVLRFLWFEKTGQIKLIRPATLIGLNADAWSHICPFLDGSVAAADVRRKELRLHYSRSYCRTMAKIIEGLDMPMEHMCRSMHPQRTMWTHVIRALRLTEFARKASFPRLRELLDKFYREDYTVPQGIVNEARLNFDLSTALRTLKTMPGAFARQLFANMLWFGPDKVLDAFRSIVVDIPTRLIISLGNAASRYFDPNSSRTITTITGIRKTINANKMLVAYSNEQLVDMIISVQDLWITAIKLKYAIQPASGKKHIFIDPALDAAIVPVGDRAFSVTDIGSAMPGMRFPVTGDKVRLFIHWGKGMQAQHLDLDLTAVIVYDDHSEYCAYHHLTAVGAQHSGDMREIPDNVGTAEYIELDIRALRKSGAKYVVFNINNYSGGMLPPGTLVGWMNSKFEMKVHAINGVSYNPANVEMLIRLPQNINGRSMAFGILDVEANDIIYIEYPGEDQFATAKGASAVIEYLDQLRKKLTFGRALRMMAEAQDLQEVSAEQLAEDAALTADTLIFDASALNNVPQLLKTIIPE